MNDKINYWIFGISILMLGASLYLNVNSVVITNESIVLVFVGILATFIVVGNFAQVTEIRNSTDKQINSLETNIQNKIKEFDDLHIKIENATMKLFEVEKKTNYNSGESYRLFGGITSEKEFYKLSVAHYISALYYYCLSDNQSPKIESILGFILDNLAPEKWNKSKGDYDFKFDEMLGLIREIPVKCEQKQEIINLLEKYKDVKE